ncbi:hypothetical protein MKY30_04335 [Oceanobacillus sp. FSL W8-0428]|uniref:hypothetical protein n=1 Tax=Oceanobacillus sp. FSL W8-0428 TaxID=2921715 RepID=UPI0012EE6487
MSLSFILVPIAIGATSAISLAMSEKIEEGEFYKITTSMKDNTMLTEALQNYGCNVTIENERMQSSLGNTQLAFQQEENGTFSAIFAEDVAVEDAKELLTNIQNEYTSFVQKQTYDKLLQRAEKEGLMLESENTDDEDTIVLTFQVRENRNYE